MQKNFLRAFRAVLGGFGAVLGRKSGDPASFRPSSGGGDRRHGPWADRGTARKSSEKEVRDLQEKRMVFVLNYIKICKSRTFI